MAITVPSLSAGFDLLEVQTTNTNDKEIIRARHNANFGLASIILDVSLKLKTKVYTRTYDDSIALVDVQESTIEEIYRNIKTQYPAFGDWLSYMRSNGSSAGCEIFTTNTYSNGKFVGSATARGLGDLRLPIDDLTKLFLGDDLQNVFNSLASQANQLLAAKTRLRSSAVLSIINCLETVYNAPAKLLSSLQGMNTAEGDSSLSQYLVWTMRAAIKPSVRAFRKACSDIAMTADDMSNVARCKFPNDIRLAAQDDLFYETDYLWDAWYDWGTSVWHTCTLPMFGLGMILKDYGFLTVYPVANHPCVQI
jgi:hypothetical protein